MSRPACGRQAKTAAYKAKAGSKGDKLRQILDCAGQLLRRNEEGGKNWPPPLPPEAGRLKSRHTSRQRQAKKQVPPLRVRDDTRRKREGGKEKGQPVRLPFLGAPARCYTRVDEKRVRGFALWLSIR
jgi:hypothetical protein